MFDARPQHNEYLRHRSAQFRSQVERRLNGSLTEVYQRYYDLVYTSMHLSFWPTAMPAQAAAADHDAGAARLGHHAQRVLGLPDVAVAEHRDGRHLLFEGGDGRPVGGARVSLRRGPGMQRNGFGAFGGGDAAGVEMGAVLVVDATQGVEAQTVSNATLAINANLDIVPAINKIDLPSANLPNVYRQLEDIVCIPHEEAIHASAKMGIGIDDILEAVVRRIPPPETEKDGLLRALVGGGLERRHPGKDDPRRRLLQPCSVRHRCLRFSSGRCDQTPSRPRSIRRCPR